MLQATRYELRITAAPKTCGLDGQPRAGHDYHVTLVWDARVWLDAAAPSPEALGRIVGEAVRGMAESYEQMAPAAKLRHPHPHGWWR